MSQPVEIPIIDDYMNMIYKMAWQCYRRMGSHTRWTIDDLIQEGCVEFYRGLNMWKPEKGPFGQYLYFWLRGEYANRLDSYMRNEKHVTFVDGSELECPDRVPAAGVVLDPEILKVKEPLSTLCQRFVDCLFSPPAELLACYEAWKQTNKTAKNNIRKPLCRFLGISDSQYEKIRHELRVKAELVLD